MNAKVTWSETTHRSWEGEVTLAELRMLKERPADFIETKYDEVEEEQGEITKPEITVSLWAESDECPSCGCKPGDGVTIGCNDPTGCGFSTDAKGAEKHGE